MSNIYIQEPPTNGKVLACWWCLCWPKYGLQSVCLNTANYHISSHGTEPFRSRANFLPGANMPIGPWPIRSMAFSFPGTFAPWLFSPVRINGVQTLRTRDTSDTRHFGTIETGPKCPDSSALVPKRPYDTSAPVSNCL